MKLRMGRYDDPLNQAQPEFTVELNGSNIAVFGAPNSGKTVFIKTLLTNLAVKKKIENDNRRSGEEASVTPAEYVYIIDFGGNIGDYGGFWNICACVDDSNEENIRRVIKAIEKRLQENILNLNSQSYYYVAMNTPEKCPPHYTLIIENINSFLADDKYAVYHEKFISLCRDGLSKGLSVIFTANDTSGTGKLLSYFSQKVVFDMPEASRFDILGEKGPSIMKNPGRGIVNKGGYLYEFQCYLPFAKKEQEGILYLSQKEDSDRNPFKLLSFPATLTENNYQEIMVDSNKNRNGIVVGLDYYEHEPICVDLNNNHSIAIWGKRGFGKTNLLWLLIKGIQSRISDCRIVLFDDGRKQLEPIHQFLSKKSEYFTALNDFRDYLTENGYGGTRRYELAKRIYADQKPKAMEPASLQSIPVEYKETKVCKTPFTVFVLQSKLLYQDNYLIQTQLPRMVGNASENGYLFIFSDVQRFADISSYAYFNSYIEIAFLLDNISDFVLDKGSRTVFGSFDVKELKSEYAKCSLGDGYYYDVLRDELQKLKFIKGDYADGKQ